MRHHLNRYAAALLLSCSAAAYAQPVWAADAVAPADDVRISGLEEVVVTATRRQESLQRVPVAVTALTADALQSEGITGVRNLTTAVPGFNGGRNFIGLQPTIRGVGSSGVSIGDESNVALYIDGVYQPSSHSNTIDLVEISRVEVLRGPQGTLFGRNATGGLINVITPDPSFTAGGRALASVGSVNGAVSFSGGGYATGALSDTAAADVALLYRYNAGYIDDLVTGGRTGDGADVNLRTKVLYEPTDWARAILGVAYNNNRDTSANAVQPYEGNTFGNNIPGTIRADKPFTTALSLPQITKTNSWNVHLKTEFDLEHVNIETTSAYFTDTILQQSDNDASPLIGGQNRVGFGNQAFTQEVRLLSQDEGPLQWIAGAYYFHLSGDGDIYSYTGVAPNFTTFTTAHILPKASTQAWAGFLEGSYALTDALTLTLGGRYSAEDRAFSTNINGAQLVDDAKAHYNRWTYRAIAKYEFTEKTSAYASYSTGFKSGVFNTFGTSANPVKPEKIGAIEVGIKSDPLPWLRTNLAAFLYNYEDLQVTARVPDSPLYLLQNAAKAKIKGVELEAEVVATPDLKFRFAGSLMDAAYDSFPLAQVFVPVGSGGNSAVTKDVSGYEMIRAPRYTLSLSGDWGHDFERGRLGLAGNVFNSAKVYYDFNNRIYQPNYTLVNAELSWTMRETNWRVALYANNLTDAVVYQQIQSTSFADFGTLEKPREVGVRVEYQF